jgi:hypothetical protein
MKHDKGMVYVYKNNTNDKILKEEVQMKMQGLQILGQVDQTQIYLELKAGEQKVFRIVPTEGIVQFGSSTKFNVI